MLANRRHEAVVYTTGKSAEGEPQSAADQPFSVNRIDSSAAALIRKPVASAGTATEPQPYRPYKLPDRGVFEPLLDLHEAASILGMHWKTLEAKARLHQVPALKVGKRWRFRLSSLNSWLENGINSNTTDHAVVTRQERSS